MAIGKVLLRGGFKFDMKALKLQNIKKKIPMAQELLSNKLNKVFHISKTKS